MADYTYGLRVILIHAIQNPQNRASRPPVIPHPHNFPLAVALLRPALLEPRPILVLPDDLPPRDHPLLPPHQQVEDPPPRVPLPAGRLLQLQNLLCVDLEPGGHGVGDRDVGGDDCVGWGGVGGGWGGGMWVLALSAVFGV